VTGCWIKMANSGSTERTPVASAECDRQIAVSPDSRPSVLTAYIIQIPRNQIVLIPPVSTVRPTKSTHSLRSASRSKNLSLPVFSDPTVGRVLSRMLGRGRDRRAGAVSIHGLDRQLWSSSSSTATLAPSADCRKCRSTRGPPHASRSHLPRPCRR